MADDNKIIIPIEITIDDAKAALDDLTNTASQAFDKVAKQGDPGNSAASAAPSGGQSDYDYQWDESKNDYGILDRKASDAPGGDTVNASGDDTSSLLYEVLRSLKNQLDDKDSGGAGGAAGVEKKSSSGGEAEHEHEQQAVKDRDSKSPPNLEALALGETNAEIGKSAEGIRLFREALHVLHPALEEAGISLGVMTGLVRASTGGIIALGVALVGTLLVGLAKAGEETDKQKRRLDSITGAGRSGESQFEGVEKVASDLGIDKTALSKSSEVLFSRQQDERAQNRSVINPTNFEPGRTQSDVDNFNENQNSAANVNIIGRNGQSTAGGVPSAILVAALQASQEAGRIDRAKPQEIDAATSEFFKSVTTPGKNGTPGVVTADALDKLAKTIPSLADAIAKGASGTGPGGLGQDFAGSAAYKAYIQQGGRPQTGDDAIRGLARVEPDVAKESAKVPVNFSEAVDKASVKVHTFEEALGEASLRLGKFLNETPGQIYDEAKKSGALPPPEAGPGLTRSLNPPPAPYTTPTSPLDRAATATPSSSVTNTTPASPRLEARPSLTRTLNPPPIGFDRNSDGSFVRNNQPLPESTQQPATNGPRSEAAPAQPNQQVASLGSQFQQFIDAVSAALSSGAAKANLNQSGQPVNGAGVRGDAGGAAISDVAELGPALKNAADAANEAAAKFRGAQPEDQTKPPVTAADGGHIRGPGTSTSDSIDAKLSDGEYVLRADAVKKIGVDKLDKANVDGDVSHFADGGEAKKTASSTDNDYPRMVRLSTGAVYYPHSKKEYDDIMKSVGKANANLDDGSSDTPSGKANAKKSMFVGDYGEGSGFNPEAGFSLGGFVAAFAKGGYVGRAMIASPPTFQHFNTGGLAARVSRATAPVIGLASGGVARDAPAAAASEMQHWGTVDMRTNQGDYKAATERDTMRHLSSAAQSAKRYRTGNKQPNWYGGTS